MESLKGQKQNKQKQNKSPSEVITSKQTAFKNCLKIGGECLKVRDYFNAELFYGSLLSDLHDRTMDELNFNDLETYSLHCCFAYCCVGCDSKSHKSLVILNSLRQSIQLPLVPFLKAFIHVANECFSSAHDELTLCQKLLDNGYNFKSNYILSGDCIPEINDEFLKKKVNGLFFACDLLKAKDSPALKENFFANYMKLGALSEIDFTKTPKERAEAAAIQEKKSQKPSGTGAVKKSETKSETVEEKRKVKGETKAVGVQTAAVNRTNVGVQTTEKIFYNKELMGAVHEIKTKVNNLQSKKDDEVKKLQKKINELTDKLAAKEKMTSQLELHKQQQIAAERKLENAQQQVLYLQKLVMEQVQHKYQLQKNIYSLCEQKCASKIEYLTDIKQYLNEGSRLTADECVQETSMWEKLLSQLTRDKDDIDRVYKTISLLVVRDNTPVLKNDRWPEVPIMPSDMQDVVYRRFRTVVQQAHNTANCSNVGARNETIQGPRDTPPGNLWDFHNLWANFNVESVWNDSTFNGAPQNFQRKAHIPGNFGKPSLGHRVIRPATPPGYRSSAQTIVSPLSAPLSPSVGGPIYANKTPPNVNPTQPTDAIGYESEQELFEYLKQNFKEITDLDLLNIVIQIREANRGTLVGLSKSTLVGYIKKKIKIDAKNRRINWGDPGSSQIQWKNDHSENKCCICFDEYSTGDSCTLLCQHEFHKKCITNWLKRQRACPVCRRHVVMDEEFPALKST